MKDGLPVVYWTFRTAWTVVHLAVVLTLVVALLVWSFTDGNLERALESFAQSLMDLQREVASLIPFPWDD